MKTLDANTAGQMAPAGAARPRVDAAFGGGLGMYPCAWRLGVSTISFSNTTSVSFTAIANRTHKAWRPTEHSP